MNKVFRISLLAATIMGFTTGALATCQLGNHGAVRGWAHVDNGTLVAEDGCLLQMDYPQSDYSVSSLQDLRDNGHFNTIRYSIFLGAWYNDQAPGQTIQDIENNLDYVISNAQQTGLYVLIDNHNTLPDSTGNNYGCPDWPADTTIWNAIAPRYANDTNVIYEIQNEPDWCGSESYNDIAQNEDQLYQLIRSYAPSTPIFAWTFLNPSWVFTNYSGGLDAVLGLAPDINYSNTSVDFHEYSGGDTNFVNTARSYPAPVTMSEYGICVGSSWDNILSNLVSLGVSWSCGDGYPDNNPGFVVTWPSDASGSSGIDTSAWYQVVSQDSGYCIDDYGYGTSNGTVLDQWACDQQYSKEWQFSPAATSGYYAITSRYASPLVVDNYGSVQNGGGVYLWSYSSGDANQEWQPQDLGNGLWRFVSLDSGLCLDDDGSHSEGTQMITWQCTNGNPNQEFSLVRQ